MQEATTKLLERMLFTSSRPDASSHGCVVAIDKKHAVSYRHGRHSSLGKDQNVMLYNVWDQTVQYETVVLAFSDPLDVIVFKLLAGEFSYYPRAPGSIYCGQSYLQLGVNPRRQPTWNGGTISEKKVGFYYGTSHGKNGDSGSGIFDYNGDFLGISIAKKSFKFVNPQNMTIEEIADHHPDTQIISSDSIWAVSGIVDPDFEPAEKKHASDTVVTQ